jgi:hypothetical protein
LDGSQLDYCSTDLAYLPIIQLIYIGLTHFKEI